MWIRSWKFSGDIFVLPVLFACGEVWSLANARVKLLPANHFFPAHPLWNMAYRAKGIAGTISYRETIILLELILYVVLFAVLSIFSHVCHKQDISISNIIANDQKVLLFLWRYGNQLPPATTQPLPRPAYLQVPKPALKWTRSLEHNLIIHKNNPSKRKIPNHSTSYKREKQLPEN